MSLRYVVELNQGGICRAMHVNRVGLQAQFRPVDEKRLDLVEKHDRRAKQRLFRDGIAEQARDRTLGAAQG